RSSGLQALADAVRQAARQALTAS
ncbi:cysteine desulfurase sulfur acceptor subunit CsdE, partial [Pantoea sp. ARC270]